MTDHPLEELHLAFYGHDRAECVVEVDGTWHFGVIRSWDRDEHGDWSAYVMWSTGPCDDNQLGRFPAERVRPE